MTDLELIFTMLGEKATTSITQARDDHTFDECRQSANRGGRIARNAREELEEETKTPVVSKSNFLGTRRKDSLGQKK